MFSWSIALSLSSITDAANAIGRLYDIFEAELLEKTHTIDPSLDVALEVKSVSFTWDSPPPDADDGKPGKEGASGGRMMQSSKSRAKAQALAAVVEK